MIYENLKKTAVHRTKRRRMQKTTTTKKKSTQIAKSNACTVRLNRIFVLDTNVLLHDPNALYAFKGVVIGIPFAVLEELDHLKQEPGEKGRNAREVIRTLDALRSQGSLIEGVALNNDTEKSKFLDFSDSPSSMQDNLIIETARQLGSKNCHVTLVTKDINARIKADVLGIEAEDYIKGKVSSEGFYHGWLTLTLPAKEMKQISVSKILPLIGQHELNPNEFIVLESENNPENYRLFRFLGGNDIKEVHNVTLMGTFQARNLQQLMALDLLMDDTIKLVTLVGGAGTGKTFLTLLAGLQKVMDEHVYRKFLIARPIVALGADIGFLPGDIQEKLHYWMQPVHDNLEFIYSHRMHAFEHDTEERHHKERKHKWEKHRKSAMKEYPTNIVQQLQQKGIISLEAITYMRGRSIPYQFLFIDEVQNLTPHEVKTLVSRAGEGTKVILAGDPYQIDSPYLDFSSNGLTVTTERLKASPLFATAFLEKSERSELAQLAADLL
jgi:PhoH-like ATPase